MEKIHVDMLDDSVKCSSTIPGGPERDRLGFICYAHNDELFDRVWLCALVAPPVVSLRTVPCIIHEHDAFPSIGYRADHRVGNEMGDISLLRVLRLSEHVHLVSDGWRNNR